MAEHEMLTIKAKVDVSGFDELNKKIEDFDRNAQKLERKRRLSVEVDEPSLKRAKNSLSGIVAGLAAFKAASIMGQGALIAMGRSAATALNEINTKSQKLGVTVEAFQELDYITGQTGTNMETVAQSMNRLVQKASTNAQAFKRIGVSVKDANGNLKTQETLLNETITALQGIEGGTERSAVAMELFGRNAKELEPLLNAGADSFEKLRQEAHQYNMVMNSETIRKGAETADSFDKMGKAVRGVFMSGISGALPYAKDFADSVADMAKDMAPLAKILIPNLVEGLRRLTPLLVGAAAGAVTYAIAMGAIPAVAALATGGVTALAVSIKGLTVAMMSNPIGLLAVGVAALTVAIVDAWQSWDVFVIDIKYGVERLKAIFGEVGTNIREMWLELMEFLKVNFYKSLQWMVKYLSEDFFPLLHVLADLKIPGFKEASEQIKGFSKDINDNLQGTIDTIKKETSIKMAENEVDRQRHRQQLKEAQEARQEALDKLKDTKKQSDADREAAEEYTVLDKMLQVSAEQAEEGKIAALHKRYAAQQIIATKTIRDENGLRVALLGIDKAYYEELEQLTREDYENRLAVGKKLSDDEINNLRLIMAKNKEIAEQNNPITELEAQYKTRVDILRRTVGNEAELEAQLLELRKEYLRQRLNLLMMEAQAAAAVNGDVKDSTIEAIREIMNELGKLEGHGVAAKMSEQIAEWGGYFNNIAQNMGTYFSNYYDARIEALDESHKRELRMIDNRLQAELAMYEEQLKEYEDLEERREEAKTEHEEKIAELNEKIQDHMTEEAYRAIQEQIADEEEKYNERVLILDEEAIHRDELLLAQETAEAEALARKEILEKEYAVKRAQMERKQAIADKASSTFSAVINVAQGVTKAWAQGGALLGPVFAALVAAAGAIQVAAIAARPLPEIPSFFVGGVIGGGNKHLYPYLPQPDNPHDNTLIWAQEGERVLSIEQNRIWESLFSTPYMGRVQGMQAEQYFRQVSETHNDNSTHPTMNMTIHPTREFGKRDYERMVRRGFKKILRG